MRRSDVQQRIAELKAEREAIKSISAREALARIEEARSLALRNGDSATLMKAAEAFAQLGGHLPGAAATWA